MALAARWSSTADKQLNGKTSGVTSIVSHYDFNISHFRNVFERLIVATQSKTVAGNEDMVVQRADGHVDYSVWRNQYESPTGIGLEESSRRRSHSSVQDQLTHDAINMVASVEQIGHFVDLLEANAVEKSSTNVDILSEKDIHKFESQVLQIGDSLDEKEYTSKLKAWLVSSDNFTSDHFYMTNTKENNNLNGKVLFKEYRKCWKILPSPHPNASIFVCSAEERMDICKVLIGGPTGTPYAHGLFLFDICFPQLFPNVPPMIHFMTTGKSKLTLFLLSCSII